MRSYFLDSYHECGSEEILREHGIILSAAKLGTNGLSVCNEDFSREHNAEVSVDYHGPALIDIRDSADCWLRCHLVENENLHVPATIFRRLPEGKAPSYQPHFRHAQQQDEETICLAHDYRELVCELCKQFFQAGWVTGTLSCSSFSAY